MKKILCIFMVALMMVSLVACKTEADPGTTTEPTTSGFPTYEKADEYTLVFTNDGMSIDLSWERMNKVIKNGHKDAAMMQEAIKTNQEYFSNLIRLEIVVYNYDDLKATGIKTTLSPSISLLYDKDITVSTTKPAPGTVSYIGDKYPMERLHQMQRLGFERYGVQITGIYKIGYGEEVSSEYTFKLQGRLKFEDKTDKTALHTGKLTLLDNGANLEVKYEDLFDEFAYTISDLAPYTSESIETLGVMLYTSKKETQIGTMEVLKYSYTAETRPEVVKFPMKYERAWANNQALMDEYKAVGQEMYAELLLTITLDDKELLCTYFIRCDVEDKRSETEVVQANPATATTFTQTYIKQDDMMPFVLYSPGAEVSGTDTPLIIWLHGSGECKASEELYLQRGLPKVLSDWELNDFNAYIVCPICPSSSWANPSYTEDIQKIIDYMSTHFPIDTQNISLAGHSLGGIGAAYFGGKMPNTFSRVAILSGYPCDQLKNITVPVKGFVGSVSGDAGSYNYMVGEDMQTAIQGMSTVLDATHSDVPRAAFTIDENKDNFSDLFMWLCGVE